MKKFKLKLWEKILVLFSALLFLVSFIIYVTGFPIRNFIFGIHDTDGQIKVGTLAESHGTVRRQLDGEADFKGIQPAANLYNMDILVTGADSGAILRFDNGASVSMDPSTMVRLAFLNDFSMDNISRLSRLEVFSGALNVKTAETKMIIVSSKKLTTVDANTHKTLEAVKPIVKPLVTPIPSPPPSVVASPSPSPSPSPLPAASPSPSPLPSPSPIVPPQDELKIVSAIEEKSCTMDAATQLPKKGMMLTWSTGKHKKPVFVTIWKTQMPNQGPVKVFGPLEQKTNRTLWLSRSPGSFKWRVSLTKMETPPTDGDILGDFNITSECPGGIKMLPPLVGGVANANSNRLTGSLLTDFNITLRWEALAKLPHYQVWFGKSAADKTPLLERTVEKPEFTFNKNKIFTGRMFYKVYGKMTNEFTMTSGITEFAFVFLPPELVTPDDRSVITSDEIRKEKNSLLVTWEKTNFTTGYELEIARDPDFKQIYVKQVLKENFLVIQSPPPGNYWWRARSFTEDTSSKMSAPFTFTITN